MAGRFTSFASWRHVGTKDYWELWDQSGQLRGYVKICGLSVVYRTLCFEFDLTFGPLKLSGSNKQVVRCHIGFGCVDSDIGRWPQWASVQVVLFCPFQLPRGPHRRELPHSHIERLFLHLVHRIWGNLVTTFFSYSCVILDT